MPEWSDGWTEESARDECLRYITDRPGSQSCMEQGVGNIDEAVDACVEDIKV